MLKSFLSLSALVLSVTACSTSPATSDQAADYAAANRRSPASAQGSTQKETDNKCFVGYSQAAGRCNQSAGNDDTAFSTCLAPVKVELKNCCLRGGGSRACAANAASVASNVQKSVDDKCFVDYSQAAGHCNQTAGNNDSAFNTCLTQVKSDLKTCCQENGGTATCAANSSSDIAAVQKAADDTCFVAYSQAAGSCNQNAGNNDAAFTACLSPAKSALKNCCRTSGGSKNCAADAK